MLESKDEKLLEKPTSGTVTRPRDIGFVFQQYHLMPELTVLENALLPTMKRSFIRGGTSLTPRCTAWSVAVALCGDYVV